MLFASLSRTLFHYDYVASVTCFWDFKKAYFLSWSSASPLIISTSNQTSMLFHVLLCAWSDLAYSNSFNSCPSLLVKLLLILKKPAQRFLLEGPVPSTYRWYAAISFLPGVISPKDMSVSLSRLRAPWGQGSLSNSCWYSSWPLYCLELWNCSNASWMKK